MSEANTPVDSEQPPNQSAHSDQEIDDQFRALLEGLRTTIPGVMVLFSFLLILPLQTTFADLTSIDTIAYYVSFASAALAAILLISPSVHQRVRAPISGIRRRSWSHVMFATKVTIVGSAFFAISIVSVVYLVTSLVVGNAIAIGVATAIGLVAAWAWFYLPLATFRDM